MTDRKTLDQMTSDDLDQMYEQLERAQRVAMDVLDEPAPPCPDPIECGHEAALGQAEEAARRALEQRQEMAEERYAWQERGDRAEAAIARVRAVVADLARAGWSQAAIGRRIREALDEPAPVSGPAATQATEPYPTIGLTGHHPEEQP
jgi:hypothetical protein